MVSPERRSNPGTEAVEEALVGEGLSLTKDRQKAAESLAGVLDALPPAPSSPLDAGIRRRMREAAARLASAESRSVEDL